MGVTLTKSKHYENGLTRLSYILSRLMLPYKKGTDPELKAPTVLLKQFGITIFIVKNRREPFTTPSGEHMLFFCQDFSEQEIDEFGRSLMWDLIDAGFFAYLRELSNRGERLATILLVRHEWGKRILKKRLTDWEDVPSRVFMRKRLKVLMDEYSMPELVSRWPSMFDYLI